LNDSFQIHKLQQLYNKSYGGETRTRKARDARRITAAELKYMRRTTGYTWTDYKTNCEGIRNNANFGKIIGIQQKLDTTCK